MLFLIARQALPRDDVHEDGHSACHAERVTFCSMLGVLAPVGEQPSELVRPMAVGIHILRVVFFHSKN
jgi:hypothetical protein